MKYKLLKKDYYRNLDERIQKFADFNQKLIFLPHLAGSQAPNWDKEARS